MKIDNTLLIVINWRKLKQSWYWYRLESGSNYSLVLPFNADDSPISEEELKRMSDQGRIFVRRDKPGKSIN